MYDYGLKHMRTVVTVLSSVMFDWVHVDIRTNKIALEVLIYLFFY